jgi:alpha-tubulin suppressor-like RCC1 family protein
MELMRSPYPIDAYGLEDAVAIEGGAGFFCAIRRSGQVVVLGQQRRPRDRPRERRAARLRARPVTGVPDAVSIAAGQYGCAARVSGQAVCWGNNFMGRLGNGGSGQQPHRRADDGRRRRDDGGGGRLPHLRDARDGRGGLRRRQRLQRAARHGPASTTPWRTSPGSPPTVDVAIGYRHACALLRDGTATCWGQNAVGELGRGTTSPVGAPRARCRASPTSWSVTSHAPNDGPVEGSHTCALRRNGELYCWGKNDLGQLGDGTMTGRPSPTRVTF